jgi:hypothetical protein
MKNLFLIIAILTIGISLKAQKNVVLDINHMIHNIPLSLSGTVYNTPNGIYNVNRVQYYVSGIQLVHDGGQAMDLVGLYLLIDGSTSSYNLGSYNVTNIEEIRYNIGVDSAANHMDPSTYAAGDPLAFHNPSTHWGWTAGYMFFMFMGEVDGTSSGMPNTVMEFATVGDQYLTPITVNTSTATTTTGSTITVYINADYDLLFDKVGMAGINHGTSAINDRLMGNFALFPVFYPANITSALKISNIIKLIISPNPSIDKAILTYDFETNEALTLLITDQLGRVVQKFDNLSNRGVVELLTQNWMAGIYNYSFFEAKQLIVSRKLIVSH